MRFFRKKKRELAISCDVTAIDGVVLARKGDVVDEKFISHLREIGRQADTTEKLIRDTEIYAKLDFLLDRPEYQFISNCRQKKDQQLELLGSLSLRNNIFRELQWMERYDYHIHHCLIIALLVTRMSLDFFEDKEQARQAAATAIGHDIGITRVPADILNKIGQLDDKELHMLREHPVYSYILLSYYYGDPEHPNAMVAYEHHEDLLGTGYPRGIVQQERVSQCIRLCDTYDALISARPFRKSLSPKEAWEKVAEQASEGYLDFSVFILLNSYLNFMD